MPSVKSLRPKEVSSLLTTRLRDQTKWIIPTAARVVFGTVFILEGTQKLFGWWGGSPPGSGHPEPALSWPYWWAGIVELVVGVMLTLGLFTQIAALMGAGAMAYAYFFEHLPVHWNPAQNNGGYAATLCWGMLLLATAAGDSRFSLDRSVVNRHKPGAAGLR